MRAHRSPSRVLRLVLIAGVAVASPVGVSSALAQARQLIPAAAENPIYIADSPIATDALSRASDLLAQRNLDEAVRLCDEIIRNHGDRLIRLDENDQDRVHIRVRQRVNGFIQSHPELLETYRRQITPVARVWLDDDSTWARAAQDAWLTEPGLIASLRIAQQLIEAGRFHAGLGVLSDLDTHPDAQGYVAQSQALRELAIRFLDADPPIAPEPYRARSLVWNTESQPGVSLDGIVPSILARAALTPSTQLDLGNSSAPSRMSGASWKPTPWCVPLVEDQHLFTNDGYTISCFDRFTMRPIWRVQTYNPNDEIPTTPDGRARLGRLLEDITSITSDGRDALFVTPGVPRNSQTDPITDVVRLDQRTGNQLWRVNIRSLDDSLSDASIRGPIVLDQGTIVVIARTNNRRQRLISLSVVGLDAATGHLEWVQPLASAGSLPFQQSGQLAHNPIVRDGIAYYTDLIGFGAAIRVATGEVLWARPLPAPDLYKRSNRPAFAGNAPVINDHGLFVLTSDGGRILQIDPASGRTIASRPSDSVGESYYLLSVDSARFICVSDKRVSIYDAARFANTSSRRSPELGDDSNAQTGIRGRVVVMGDRILAPVEMGVRVLNPDRLSEPGFISLDSTGNIAALDGQLIVVDQIDVMGFLSWETASMLLEQRVATDPSAAVTIAELAHRTGRTEDIVPSVQRAMRVVSAQPMNTRSQLRDALFDVVLRVIRGSEFDQDSVTKVSIAQLGQERVDALMLALGELARTHDQGVAYRMELGSLHERYRDFDKAILAYQGVLDQHSLRSAMWEGSEIAVRAGLEATRRIGRIIEREGFGPYQSADDLARAEIEYLGENATPQQYESLAQRFPWSRITPLILLRASERYIAENKIPSSIEAARSGIERIERLGAMGQPLNQVILGTLADALISGLIETNRAREAHATARSLLEAHPSLELLRRGQPVTLEQLATAAGNADTLPRLGSRLVDNPSPLLVTGSPLRPAHRLDPGGVLMYAPQLGRLQYLRAGRNVFEPFWERTAPGTQPPTIVWQGPTRVLIFWPESVGTGDTGTLECVDTSTGTLVWAQRDIRTALEQGSARVADDTARIDSLINIPGQGAQPTHQLVVASDGQSVVVTDRIGRAMGIDLYAGDLLWQRDLPINRVHDIDLRQGALGICGVMIVDRAQDQRNGSTTPIAARIDPRTGEPGQVTERFGHQPRWVRIGDRSRLFVASTVRLSAFNTDMGTVDWVVNSEDIADSLGAWVTDTHLLVLSDRRALWAIDPSDGSRSPRPMDTHAKLTARGWMRVIPEIGRTVLLSNAGFIAYDNQNQTLGVDSRSIGDSLTDIAWGRDHALMLGQPRIEGDQLHADLTLIDHRNAVTLDTTTLKLPASIGRRGQTVVPVNGGVLVGFGEVSVFVRTED
jgi:outer membrane protein assembly factor BamB